MLLLLFDIDGTLLAGASAAHAEALHEALREVHGVDAARTAASVSPAGRTDGEIARLLLLERRRRRRRAIDERADAVREACCAATRELLPARSCADRCCRGSRSC